MMMIMGSYGERKRRKEDRMREEREEKEEEEKCFVVFPIPFHSISHFTYPVIICIHLDIYTHTT
jgi:hypothetical protein